MNLYINDDKLWLAQTRVSTCLHQETRMLSKVADLRLVPNHQQNVTSWFFVKGQPVHIEYSFINF